MNETDETSQALSTDELTLDPCQTYGDSKKKKNLNPFYSQTDRMRLS